MNGQFVRSSLTCAYAIKFREVNNIMNDSSEKNTFDIMEMAVKTLYNPILQDYKKNGGKIVGYYYSYIPEEIITAAGLIPYRIRATNETETDFSDVYFTQINCSFVRYNFNMILQNKFNFLDGVVSSNACDHLRRHYDNWSSQKNSPCFHFMVVPQKKGDAQMEQYCKELFKFKNKIEEQFNIEITDKKLRQAIKIHNKTRKLQRELYELRKLDNPPVTGAEVMTVMIAGFSMPKTDYNQLLEAFLKDVQTREIKDTGNVRLMLTGGELDNPELINVIEGQGAVVVTDMIWYGSRAIIKDVDEDEKPLQALAAYYLNNRPADPRIYGTSFERFDLIKKLSADYKVDGIIGVRLPLCDQYSFDNSDFAQFAKKENLDYLNLETDYALSNVGQLKTRVQAFIEKVSEV